MYMLEHKVFSSGSIDSTFIMTSVAALITPGMELRPFDLDMLLIPLVSQRLSLRRQVLECEFPRLCHM